MSSILVTGGTGSFGQAYVRHLLETPAERIVVYSRDELKQHEMRQAGLTSPRLRYFIGDVRDRDRLRRAMQDVQTVVHAAALKQVDSIEYNPLEAVHTNIMGTENVIQAALDARVERVLMLGTDKAVDPTNLYGATKLVAEKLIVDANVYAGTLFSSTRYGNVISSRGSVLPVFLAQKAAGLPLTITDPSMTRFVVTLDTVVRFASDCLEAMVGGEVFIPKLDAVTVDTIADVVDPIEYDRTRYHRPGLLGRRPGEKQHELLVSEHEAHRTLDADWCYIVKPIHDLGRRWSGVPVGEGFRYSSDTAPRLSVEMFKAMADLW